MIEVKKQYYRPTDVDYLCGDYSLAKEKLGWEPNVSINELIEIMVKSDNDLIKKLK